MSHLPPPRDLDAPVSALVRELAERTGRAAFVERCTDLLAGADRADHVDVLPYLTGLSFAPGSPTLDPGHWPEHWVRTWGARGLLHVWDDTAGGHVVAGLSDEHWRPAEMCLKVSARHAVAGAGDGAALLAGHGLPRVRAQAMRALAAVGDTEHVATVRDRLDDPHPDVRRAAARTLERLALRLDLPD